MIGDTSPILGLSEYLSNLFEHKLRIHAPHKDHFLFGKFKQRVVLLASEFIIFYSPQNSRSEYHLDEVQISLRSNITRRRRIELKKALAFASAFFSVHPTISNLCYIKYPVNLTLLFSVSITVKEIILFPFVSSFNSAFSDEDLTRLSICSS